MIKQTRKTFHRPALFSAIAATMALSTANQLHADGLMLEEIIVTAQKRTENLQDVAAAISAVNSESLNDNGINDFKDASKLVPGLVMKQDSATDTSISLRGITFERHSASSEAVDVYWNDSPYRAGSMFTSMFDVERLEVLRGPQGTLQGKTSPAGAILMHTKGASFDGVEGQIKTTLNEDGDQISEFGLNLPLTDTLAMRVAGMYNSNDGRGNKNLFSGEEDSNRVQGARVSLSYEPNDDFEARLSSEFVEHNAADTDQMAGSYNGHTESGYPDADYGDIAIEDNIGLSNNRHTVDLDTEISNLKMTWRGIEGHELTSITAHNSTYMNETSDRDKSNIYQGSQERSNIDYLARNFTQELRLSSTEESSWEYTLGAFYSKMITRSTNTNDIAPSAVGLPLMYLYTAIEKESFGYFMNNRIDLSEDSELQIGLRYNRLRNDYVGTMELPAFNIVVDQNSERDYVDDSFTGGIKYVRHINDEIMAYTSLDVSHRPAGTTMNPRVVYHPEALRSSEEETLAFEAGFKSTLFNGRMQVNGAAYYQEMNEYQAFFKEINVQDSVGDSINPVNLLKNTDAISMGAELEATGLISENWRAGMLMSYNDFKFADGSEGYCNEGPALDAATNWVNSCDVSGSRIGNNPNWNVSISSDYLLPLDEVDLFLRGLYTFNGASFQPALPVEERKAGAHSLIDLFAGVRSKDSDWEVSLWAKNLLDKATETEKVAADENGYRDVTVTAPRTLGASLRYNFSL